MLLASARACRQPQSRWQRFVSSIGGKNRWENVTGSRRERRKLQFGKSAGHNLNRGSLGREEFLRPQIVKHQDFFERKILGRSYQGLKSVQGRNKGPGWLQEKLALKAKLNGQPWRPAKRLSPDQMDDLKKMANMDPQMTVKDLAAHFEINIIAAKKILKSKWQPRTIQEADERMLRWRRMADLQKPHVRYCDTGKVGINDVAKYTITIIAHPANAEKPLNVWVRIRNVESSLRRLAYLIGPYLLCVSVRDARFDPYTKSENLLQIAFDPRIKASHYFSTCLSIDTFPSTWIIEITSQVIFSNRIKVGYNLSLSDRKEMLDSSNCFNGSYGPISVVFQGSLELWKVDKSLAASRNDLHLVVLTHGLHSNLHADLYFLKEQLDRHNKKFGKKLVVMGFTGNICRTEAGVKKLGRRMARWLEIVLGCHEAGNSRKFSHYTSISFIGHSLGGLIQTYALGYLDMNNKALLQNMKLENFVLIASPMLGIAAENPNVINFALDLGVLGKTGQDLAMIHFPKKVKSDTSKTATMKPLIEILSIPDGPSHRIIKKFKKHTLYANIANDGIVPLRTSCLYFLDWESIASEEKLLIDTSSKNDNHDGLGIKCNMSGSLIKSRTKLMYTPLKQKSFSDFNIFKKRSFASDINFSKPFAALHLDSLFYKFWGHSNNVLWIKRSQTKNTLHCITGFDEYSVPPRMSLYQKAIKLMNPPDPELDFIMNPDSRPNVILHDKVYNPIDIPDPGPKTLEIDLDKQRLKLEEKIARNWHTDISWRKVIVKLEPDAHNNIIVRRMFPNAYGWPIICHMIEQHF